MNQYLKQYNAHGAKSHHNCNFDDNMRDSRTDTYPW
jgi:hypothetical protein